MAKEITEPTKEAKILKIGKKTTKPSRAPIKLTNNFNFHCLGFSNGVNMTATAVVSKQAGKVKINTKISPVILNCPVSISKDCYTAAVFADTVNIHLIRANHKVHMDIRAVKSCSFKLFLAHLCTTNNTSCICCTNSQVVRGIFIKEGIEESNA